VARYIGLQFDSSYILADNLILVVAKDRLKSIEGGKMEKFITLTTTKDEIIIINTRHIICFSINNKDTTVSLINDKKISVKQSISVIKAHLS